MSPMPNDNHQRMATRIAAVFKVALGWEGGAQVVRGREYQRSPQGLEEELPRARRGCVPGGDEKAENLETHWLGGPDFGVEITSPGDETREKIPFYEKVGTQELMIIDRDPWAIELYRCEGEKLTLVGKTTLDEPQILEAGISPCRSN